MKQAEFKDWKGWPKGRTAIIAEIGMNHGGSEKLAWKMIQAASRNGADFVKLQSYITKDFLHPCLSYYSDIKNMELSLDAQRRLFRKAKEKGIKLITTPYDFASVDMVEGFEPCAYKIASMDNDNIPLIRYISRKKRPILISCGMADLDDIKRIVKVLEDCKNNKIVLLHCVSEYPTKPADLNLSMISLLKDKFGYPVGLSDHSIGLFSPYIATSSGIKVIEKHFTIDRSLAKRMPSADHDISIEPTELKELRRFCEAVPIMIGNAPRLLTRVEKDGRDIFKRGLYAKRDIRSGEILTLENTMFLRPVKGIRASQWNKVCKKKVVRKITKLEPICLLDIKL